MFTPSWSQRRVLPCFILVLVCGLATGLGAAGVLAAHPADLPPEKPDRPDGIHILDGSYVLDVGELHVNVTNHGLIGSQYSTTMPYSQAPSGQWPRGSGNEYLWGAGLWIGARSGGDVAVTTGQPERELRPDSGVFDTIYEAKSGYVTRPWPGEKPTGFRLPHPRADDDGDKEYDEDMLNGRDDDGDGLVDEDFGQIGDQMFTCTMHDYLPLVRENYPAHIPLGVTVVQRAATWADAELNQIVILDYEVTNAGHQPLEDLYFGMYVDCDIQRRGDTSSNPDDLAGFYRGALRDETGVFRRLEIAWMRDADPEDPLPGWFGTILLDHPTDFIEYRAPRRVGVNSFQIFATNASVNQHGEPLSDIGRYEVLSSTRIDRDRRSDQPADLKTLISSGPFNYFLPGKTLYYRVAFVIGDSKEEMLANALKATRIVQGRGFNLDNNWTTGYGAAETKVCLGDLPRNDFGEDPLLTGFRISFMDEFCTGRFPVFGYPVILKEIMFQDDDGRACIYANTDNCEECFRYYGEECTQENGLYWQFLDNVSWYRYPQYFTGVGGGETRVPWISIADQPPRPPSARLVAGSNQVEIFWDDASEYDVDFNRGVGDFESYQVWRVADRTRPPGTSPDDGPRTVDWAMIEEFDLVNFTRPRQSEDEEKLPLGRNTGLEVAVYRPVCLDDRTFAGLAEVMQVFVDNDPEGKFLLRPLLRDSDGAVIPGREILIPWETWPAVLDTFFAVTPRAQEPGVVGKRSVRYYSYLDAEVHNGFETYYAVVASDHLMYRDGDRWILTGYGIHANPGNHDLAATPIPDAQTAAERAREGQNIYVFPNPATRASLAEFQKQPPSGKDPTGERVMFMNLPAARNIISIFTASGDHVATIEHDGRAQGGAATWNLMSRNGQQIVSGIYLYSVQSDDSGFEDFRGRFVVVR
jgi:hypothetical protein